MARFADRTPFISAAEKIFGAGVKVFTRDQVKQVCDTYDVAWPNWMTVDPRNRLGRGLYSVERQNDKSVTVKPTVKVLKNTNKAKVVNPTSVVPTAPQIDDTAIAAMAVAAVQMNVSAPIDLVPEKATGYVPFGNFADVRQIIKSGKFYPMYITGLSGNGKTMMVEQVCAAEKREMVRVNITIETDEDDLIGGFRLVDGRTVWQNGPVVVAMERGAVLLLDEVDLGSNKMMCLQPVLEGKPIYLKKINKVITPMPGFNIVATANTKGKGSDDGRFIGTNIMNEAFLERFSITMEQEYPSLKTEEKILTNVLGSSGIENKDFVTKLVQWADVIRKSFYEGAVSEIISTRRLVHICEAFTIFNQNREKAIQLCLNRFDVDTKNSFLELYKKLDETVVPVEMSTATVVSTEEIAF
jgi:midasin (ATPase involved in ribosome maturation)